MREHVEITSMDFDTHVKRTIGYWCNKLTQSARFVASDKDKGISASVPSPSYPMQDDLESIVWVKVADPKVWEELHVIWFDPSFNGGQQGVSRYLSVICTNTFIDEHRKIQVRYWDQGISLQTEYGNGGADGADGADGETIKLVDLITADKSDLALPFGFEDLSKVLSPQGYQILFDHFAYDGDFRSLASEIGMSKSQVARIAKRAIAKVAGWFDQLKHGPTAKAIAHQKPLILSAPWMQRRSLRPDRIPSEILDHWNDDTVDKIVPFFTCPHDPREGSYKGSSGMNQIECAKCRWALCDTCNRNYWRSLMEQIEADLLKENLARLESMVGDLGTEALGVLEVIEYKGQESWDK